MTVRSKSETKKNFAPKSSGVFSGMSLLFCRQSNCAHGVPFWCRLFFWGDGIMIIEDCYQNPMQSLEWPFLFMYTGNYPDLPSSSDPFLIQQQLSDPLFERLLCFGLGWKLQAHFSMEFIHWFSIVLRMGIVLSACKGHMSNSCRGPCGKQWTGNLMGTSISNIMLSTLYPYIPCISSMVTMP